MFKEVYQQLPCIRLRPARCIDCDGSIKLTFSTDFGQTSCNALHHQIWKSIKKFKNLNKIINSNCVPWFQHNCKYTYEWTCQDRHLGWGLLYHVCTLNYCVGGEVLTIFPSTFLLPWRLNSPSFCFVQDKCRNLLMLIILYD